MDCGKPDRDGEDRDRENRDRPLFDDLAKMMASVAGTMAGAGREVQAKMRDRWKDSLAEMGFVGREEFEALKAMAAATKAELDALKAGLGREKNSAGGHGEGSDKA